MADISSKTAKDVRALNFEACFEAKRERIQTQAGPIEIACMGEGAPLLSIHGGPGGCDQGLVLAMPFVRAGFRVISVSRPGYLGTPLESGVSFDDQADLLASLMDALGFDSLPVLGASAGGPVAYLLAQRHSKRVQALVVIDGVTQTYSKAEQLSVLEEAIFLGRPGLWLMDWMGRHFPASVVKGLLTTESTLREDALAERVKEVVQDPEKLSFVRMMIRTMTEQFKQRQEGLRNDLSKLAAITMLKLDAISCSTLIIHGDADADVPADDARWAHQQIQDSRLYAIPGGSHLAFWIAPGAAEAQELAISWMSQASD
jgi:pimeloyl-ACP methyl ester carboxylesterase